MPDTTRLFQNLLLPFRAQQRLNLLKYGPESRVSVTQGATTFDVAIDSVGWDTSIQVDCVPMVTLNWTTPLSVIPIPPATDFKGGFRVVFGSAAPANAELSYAMRVTP